MRIGLAAPIWYPIPPVGYGGIELVVSLLAEGLVANGHEVTLFASGDSKTDAELVSVYEKAPSERIGQVYPDLINAINVYANARRFDVIHDHSGIIGPSLGAFCDVPVLHTLHGPATQHAKELYGALNFGLYFNAISEYQRRQFGNLNFIATIYNAVDFTQFPFSDSKGDHLIFLGRMNPEKGAHIAVEVANRLGKKLLMVTKMTEQHENHYFETQVEPLLNSNVEIIGEVDTATKAKLLSEASCTLFPIQWPEPFGLVMIESLATGTPVIAIGQGAVPEVMENGRTGFIVNTAREMAEAVDLVGSIDPHVCRRVAEERFSKERMVADYEAAYSRLMEMEAAA